MIPAVQELIESRLASIDEGIRHCQNRIRDIKEAIETRSIRLANLQARKIELMNELQHTRSLTVKRLIEDEIENIQKNISPNEKLLEEEQDTLQLREGHLLNLNQTKAELQSELNRANHLLDKSWLIL